jgi:hypothetical protein
MLMRGRALVAGLALLLLPGAAAQVASLDWGQFAGGPGHPGVALLPGAPLDIQRATLLLGPASQFVKVATPVLLETPDGLVGLASNRSSPGECSLVALRGARFDDVARAPLADCHFGILQAYDAGNDALLVCSEEAPAGPVFQSRDRATGELRWAIRPDPDLGDAGAGTWACFGAAVDGPRGEAGVAFVKFDLGRPADHRIARINLASGRLVWVTVVPSYAFQVGAVVNVAGVRDPGAARAMFLPLGVTLTDTGTVVTGLQRCETGCVELATGVNFQFVHGAAAWIRDDGTVMGGMAALMEPRALNEDQGLQGRSRSISNAATAKGAVAAFTIGNRVLRVNPTEQQPIADQPMASVESSLDYTGLTTPHWWQDVLVVPLSHSITAFDAATLAPRWSWTEGPEWDVSEHLIAPPGDLYVLEARAAEHGKADSRLVRLDLASGEVRQSLPLPVSGEFLDGRWVAEFLPLRDGRVAVADASGDLLLLGPALPGLAPAVRVSNTYPAPDETVRLTAASGPGAAAERFAISWGEGPIEDLAPGAAALHRYTGADVRTLRVTAFYPGGRTGTAEVVMRVGGTAPQELNLLQAAFAPDNQNLTFGALGLAATGIGVSLAGLSRKRRKTRLGQELRRLEEIRELGGRDALAAVRALEEFRGRVLREVAEGLLDDAQFSVLELRVSRLLQALRLRVLGPFAGRVSEEYGNTLEAALEDGRITPDEAAELRRSLAKERGLTATDRARLTELIAMWERTSRGAAAAPGGAP